MAVVVQGAVVHHRIGVVGMVVQDRALQPASHLQEPFERARLHHQRRRTRQLVDLDQKRAVAGGDPYALILGVGITQEPPPQDQCDTQGSHQHQQGAETAGHDGDPPEEGGPLGVGGPAANRRWRRRAEPGPLPM